MPIFFFTMEPCPTDTITQKIWSGKLKSVDVILRVVMLMIIFESRFFFFPLKVSPFLKNIYSSPSHRSFDSEPAFTTDIQFQTTEPEAWWDSMFSIGELKCRWLI